MRKLAINIVWIKRDLRTLDHESFHAADSKNTPYLPVYIFDNDTPLELINLIKPDILVKGGDYTPNEIVGYEEVTSSGGEVKIVPLTPGFSTTSTIENMR